MKDSLFSLELFIAKFLRYGVYTSAFFIAVGWILISLKSPEDWSQFQQYHPQPLSDVMLQIWATQNIGYLVSYAGLTALILLPFIRVLMTSAIFIKQKEYLMAAIAGVVLLGLTFSFLMGFEL